MSSFKNAAKSHQKTHRERSQPASRQHLGLLEKKKDYKARAKDYQRKQATLKTLKRKALDKNPDEFYFKMVHTGMEDGVHKSEDKTPQYTSEQLKLIQSQDIKYVNFKRSLELKKIEKLKSNLHLLDVDDKPHNKHIIFVDSKKEAAKFDAAKHFETHPELVNRTYNRPRLETLHKQTFQGSLDEDQLKEVAKQRRQQYSELNKRIEREKQLHIIAQKMETKKHLLDKTSHKRKVRDETVDSAAVYKWVAKRKR